ARFGDVAKDFGVVGGVDDDGHIGVVLGGGADHGRAANVDILDDVVIGSARGDGLLEGVEIDRDEVDGADFVLCHRGGVGWVVPYRKKSAMHFGVEGLDAAIHHFGKAGEVGDLAHRQAGIADQLVGAAGGDQFHAGGAQTSGKVGHA